MLRTSIVVDYQNVHMTAHDIFNPHGNLWDSLIHPAQFAQRAIIERNSRQREGYEHAQLTRTLVFRGLPHVDYDWEQNRRNLDQATQWEQDGADVSLRDLKYDFQRDASGRPIRDINGMKIPVGRPQEKGIDVLCALALVREAARPDVDLVILASRDTDLVPAIDEVYDFRGMDPRRYAKVETVTWHDRNGDRNRGSLRATSPRTAFNTNLGRDCYTASIDRNQYR